jgi:hypothetical protein
MVRGVRGHRTAGRQQNKLFAPGDQKWIWYQDERADPMLSHGRKVHLEIAFVTGGQHFQALLKSLGCSPNVR